MSKLTPLRKGRQSPGVLGQTALCLLWVALIFVSPGCQGHGDPLPFETNDFSDAGTDAGVDGRVDAGTDGGTDAGTPWTMLISRDWMALPGATNTYRCRTIQVDSELYITGFRSLSPVGEYRAFLQVSDSSLETGDYNCSAGRLADHRRMIHASGMGTGAFVFPSGIAVHVNAHQYLTLTLHLANPTGTGLAGTSGVEVQLGSPVSSDHEAEMILAGKINFIIPPNGQVVTVVGGCNAARDFKVFALWPTMNGIGVRQQMEQKGNTLLEEAYDVHHQIVYPISANVKTGEQIRTTCYYLNQTGQTVTFGDGSNFELCFTGIYRYPATSQNPFECTM